MRAEVVIVDYGMGNLNSVRKKFARLNIEAKISSDPSEIEKADKLILPGVGHFRKAMHNLVEHDVASAVKEAVVGRGRPILGICLGMQLFARHSEEGGAEGLGFVDARIRRFRIRDDLSYKVPHMGWNQVVFKKQSDLMKGVPDNAEFHFVHSYHLVTDDARLILSETEYEETFVSSIEQDNVFGVQFHPEKSHDVGDVVFRNFTRI